MIPHSRPPVLKAALPRLARLLRARETAEGGIVAELEQAIAARLQRRWAIAVDSGTSALALAMRALGARCVALPAYACTALAVAARWAGCTVIWLDSQKDDPRLAPQARARAKVADAVVLVHPFGYLEPAVAEDWPQPVIEDLAMAAGARWQARAVGSFGTLAVGSLYATKPWGGAQGGFVAGDDEALRTQLLAMLGTDRASLPGHFCGGARLSALHAAVALARIEQSDEERKARAQLAARFDAVLQKAALAGARLPYRYLVRVHDASDAIARAEACGIQARLPVRTVLGSPSEVPNAWALHGRLVSLPLLADASEEEERRLLGFAKELGR